MSVEDETPEVKASDTASPPPEPLDENMVRLVHEFRELAHDHLELATLEVQLSINTLLRMVILSLVTALAFASAWLALAGSAAIGLIDLGLSPVLVMLLLAGTNLLLGILGWRRVKHMRHWLGFPATQRAIKPASDTEAKRGAE